MIKKRIVKRAVRRVSHAKKGNWSILGLVHGGKEGKQWTRGKAIVSRAAAIIQNTRHGVKADAAARIGKLSKVNLEDKKRLLREIDSL